MIRVRCIRDGIWEDGGNERGGTWRGKGMRVVPGTGVLQPRLGRKKWSNSQSDLQQTKSYVI